MATRFESSASVSADGRTVSFGVWFRSHPKASIDGTFGSADGLADLIQGEGRFDFPVDSCIREAGVPAAWIDDVRVPEELRSRGMGSALVREAVGFLSYAYGIRSFWLVAAPISEKWRRPLLAFYRKLGFRPAPEFCTNGRTDILTMTIAG